MSWLQEVGMLGGEGGSGCRGYMKLGCWEEEEEEEVVVLVTGSWDAGWRRRWLSWRRRGGPLGGAGCRRSPPGAAAGRQVGHAPQAAHWLRHQDGRGAVLHQLLPWTNER